jgi:hypothetical protein
MKSIQTVLGGNGWTRAGGTGEIRVAYEGVTFAAPVLIVHYIEEHGYLPPTQFLAALEEAELS